MGSLESIGALVLVGGAFCLLCAYYSNNEAKVRAYKDLLKNDWKAQKEFEEFYRDHSNLSYEQALRKFYTEEKVKESLAVKEEIEKEKSEYNDRQKKKYTILRVFAYEYEDFIFSIFAPYSTKISDAREECGYKWLYMGASGLKKNDIITKIRVDKRFDGKDAEELFKLFVDKELIGVNYFSTYEKNDFYTKKNERFWTYDLGTTLQTYANVISEQDLSIDKWIKTHK